MDTIDEIRIMTDEHGFELVVVTDDGEVHSFVIGLPDQFYSETRKTIGAWLAEGEAARASMPSNFGREDDDDAYDKNDPKHPMWHDNVSTIYDNREGK